MANVRESIEAALATVTPRKGARNSEAVLFEICKWQEVKAIAEAALKNAWQAAQGEDGFIQEDDKLRLKKPASNPYIVAEGGKFSATVKVSEGAAYLDQQRLSVFMARRFKVTEDRAMKCIEAAKVKTKSRLEKRVLEA